GLGGIERALASHAGKDDPGPLTLPVRVLGLVERLNAAGRHRQRQERGQSRAIPATVQHGCFSLVRHSFCRDERDVYLGSNEPIAPVSEVSAATSANRSLRSSWWSMILSDHAVASAKSIAVLLEFAELAWPSYKA